MLKIIITVTHWCGPLYNETYAYVLPDLVAWSNNSGKEPHGVIFKNLGDALEKEMMQAVR